MKTRSILMICAALTVSQPAQAEGWLDSIKSMLGMKSETTQKASPDIGGMISAVSGGLGISQDQAKGGLASLFNYAKGQASGDQFGQLAKAIPGLDGIMSAVPDISKVSEGGLSGLVDKAAEYNESLKAINTVKKQFEALGLKPEMIMGFVKQAQGYLDTEQGQAAKKLLTQQLGGLGKLLG